ncbi:hypothetical protein FJZ53_03470 [Candidatus Woesearchaeota archaeon]|nr:hypothetical protein [Candidatus Woesearchaeota archaeon]
MGGGRRNYNKLAQDRRNWKKSESYKPDYKEIDKEDLKGLLSLWQDSKEKSDKNKPEKKSSEEPEETEVEEAKESEKSEKEDSKQE